MPFPTPQKTPTTPPIQAKAPESPGEFNDIIKPKSLDDLLSEYNTPKQDFTPPESNHSEPNTPEAFSAGFLSDEPAAAIDPETARRSGRYIAKTVDSAFGLVGSTIAHSKDAKKYQADPSELNDLEEAFGDVSQEYNWNIPPYMNLLLIVFFVYAKKIKLAFSDRLENHEFRLDNLEKSKKEKDE